MEAVADRPLSGLIKYQGSKLRIAAWVVSHFPPHRLYMEPFGGSGAVLFAKPRSECEIYNDIRHEIVDVFRVVRDRRMCARLKRALRYTPYSKAEYESCYDDEPWMAGDPVEYARRMIARSFMCFGSAGAVRKSRGGFARLSIAGDQIRDHSVTFALMPDRIDWYCDRLRGVTLECSDALWLIKKYDHPDALIYCDPPYVPDKWCADSGYGDYNYSVDDHLALLALALDSRAMVIISGYDNELYNGRLSGWRKCTHESYNCRSDARREVIWINPAAARAADEADKKRLGVLFRD